MPCLLLASLAAVATEGPRRGKLTQAMTDHFFGDKHLHVDLAVMHHEGVPDKFGNDGAGPGPRLDRVLCPHHVHLFNLGINLGMNVGTFFQGSAHNRSSVCSCRMSGDRAHRPQSIPYLIFNWPWRRDLRRRTMALFDGLRRLRVEPPFANTPVGLTG